MVYGEFLCCLVGGRLNSVGAVVCLVLSTIWKTHKLVRWERLCRNVVTVVDLTIVTIVTSVTTLKNCRALRSVDSDADFFFWGGGEKKFRRCTSNSVISNLYSIHTIYEFFSRIMNCKSLCV
jgi:hypothetical protein